MKKDIKSIQDVKEIESYLEYTELMIEMFEKRRLDCEMLKKELEELKEHKKLLQAQLNKEKQ